jgi:large repetitive protein
MPITLTASAIVKAKALAAGYNDSPVVSASFTIGSPQPPKELWHFVSGAQFDSTAAIGTNGNVYIVGGDGRFYAFSASGSPLWVNNFGMAAGYATALAPDGTIYFAAIGSMGGGSDGRLFALSPAGTTKWTYPVPGRITSSPALGVDGTIYFGCYDSKLYALNPDGSLRWSFQAGDRIERPASIGTDGTLYFGSSDGKVYAVDSKGNKRWDFSTSASISSGVAIDGSGVV